MRHHQPTVLDQHPFVIAIERRNSDMNDLAKLVVGDAESDRVSHHAAAVDQILHLLGA
jgi:hypothetical protein